MSAASAIDARCCLFIGFPLLPVMLCRCPDDEPFERRGRADRMGDTSEAHVNRPALREGHGAACPPLPAVLAAKTADVLTDPLQRSEERRVGKESRSRWSPYQ